MSDTIPSLPVPEPDPSATRPVGSDTAPLPTPSVSPAGDTVAHLPVVPPPLPVNPPPPPTPPPPVAPPPAAASAGLPLGMVLAVFGLALAGIVLLGVGIWAVMSLTAPTAVAALTATPIVLPTQAVIIPTTTPQPTATDTATPEPTATATTAPPSATPTLAGAETEATAAGPTDGALVVTIISGANVRGGPGTDYAVIGGIKEGDTAPLLGISAGGGWYAIDFGSALAGRAWVSAQVATFAGNDGDLPIIAAPPKPAATATTKPANNPAPGPVTSTRGVSGQLTMCGGRLTFAVNERVCFVEMIKNNTAAPISYGILGVQAVNTTGSGTKFQTSWDAQGAADGLLWIDPGCTGPTDRCNGVWEDGIRLPSAGSWRLTMQVCFSAFSTCLNGGDWESLSAPIIVTIN